MTQPRKTSLFGRLWQLVVETSQVAVQVHYRAPWKR